MEYGALGVPCGRPSHQNHIDRRKILTVMPKGFPRNAFNPIAIHGSGCYPLADRQPQTCRLFGGPVCEKRKMAVGNALGVAKDTPKITGCQQPRGPGKTRSTGRHEQPTGQLGCQTRATFGTPSLDHLAAILGRHAGAKTVSPFALDYARLIGALHDLLSVRW